MLSQTQVSWNSHNKPSSQRLLFSSDGCGNWDAEELSDLPTVTGHIVDIWQIYAGKWMGEYMDIYKVLD